MSISAMKLALEALEEANQTMSFEYSQKDYYSEAITALRQALETEQEPVAFINVEKRKLEWAKLTLWHTPTTVNLPKIPLYTAPPKREWVGLTDEDEIPWDGVDAKSFARAVEAKLREKNT
jgi:hypothetical protein